MIKPNRYPTLEKKKSCFVIIGYGKKPSYADGKFRLLDLDETYSLLIKPVFDELNIPCYRAIDKNLTASIDGVMLKEIMNADIAVVDLSTLNANVMWELGVRHALRPKHTIMICEKAQMSSLPFDINHFPVHEYAHSDVGIPYKEVDRFRRHLKGIVGGILTRDPSETDSPVFTFLKDELFVKTKAIKPKFSRTLSGEADSFAVIMQKAEEAKSKRDYEKALVLFGKAENYAKDNMTLRDNLPLILSRKALCRYKSKKPREIGALKEAEKMLMDLNPTESQDTEVLGVSGAINKRLYELTGKVVYLDKATQFYKRGFLLKQDYYNGINVAFMLYLKAGIQKNRDEEWEDIKLEADYIRNSVLNIALELEQSDGFAASEDAIWVLLTIAECYNYKNNAVKCLEYEEKAKKMAMEKKDDFAVSSYEEQKSKIKAIFDKLNNL